MGGPTREVLLARAYLKGAGTTRRLDEQQLARFLRWLRASLKRDEAFAQLLADAEMGSKREPAGAPPPGDSRYGSEDLATFLAVWGLTKAEAARIFGVSRQAIGKWLQAGVPEDRRPVVATLGAATDLLLRHLKGDRIPAAVRRPAPARGGRSLIDVATQEGAAAVLAACREMFDFARANSPEDWRAIG